MVFNYIGAAMFMLITSWTWIGLSVALYDRAGAVWYTLVCALIVYAAMDAKEGGNEDSRFKSKTVEVLVLAVWSSFPVFIVLTTGLQEFGMYYVIVTLITIASMIRLGSKL